MSNAWIHEALNSFQSGAHFTISDSVTGARHYAGRVADPTFTTDEEFVDQNHVVKGKRRRSQRRSISETGTLSFTLLEDLNPNVMRWAFGDPSVPEVIENNETVRQYVEGIELYGTNLHEFAPYSILTYDRSYAAAIASAAGAGSAGSGWTVATYYFWVQPFWGTTPTETTFTPAAAEGLGVLFMTGKPTDEAGAGAFTGKAVAVAAVDNTVTVTWTAPTSGPTPDGYLVWGGTTDSLASAKLYDVVVGALTTALASPGSSNDPYVAGAGIGVQDVLTWDDETGATYSAPLTLDLETRLMFDGEQATLRRGTSSNLAEGTHLIANVWVIEAATVTENIGSRQSGQILRTVELEQWEPEVGGDDDWLRPEGQHVIFEQVDFASNQPDLNFTEMEFSAGMRFELEVQYNPQTNRFATRSLGSPKFANYTKRVT